MKEQGEGKREKGSDGTASNDGPPMRRQRSEVRDQDYGGVGRGRQ